MAVITSPQSDVTTGFTGEIKSISFDGIQCAEIDVSYLSSDAKSFVLGTKDGGTITLEYFPVVGALTLPTAGTATPTAFVIRFGQVSGAGFTASFNAYVKSVSVNSGVDEAITASVTLQVAGAITTAVTTTPTP